MKKILLLLLTAALLTGCAAAGIPAVPSTTIPTIPNAEASPITIGISGSDRKDVDLTINAIGEAISAWWTNKSEYMITCTENFSIEIFKDGAWVPCKANGDLCFKDIAYELQSGNELPLLYPLEMFDVSKNGLYRFTAECWLQTPDAPTKCQVWAQFTVGNMAVIQRPINKDQLLEGIVGCGYTSQVIRTDGYHEGAEYPIITVIRSVDQLNAYYDQYKSLYNLGNPSDSADGFLNACEKYDDAYFAQRPLILILLETGSGSVHHTVSKAGFSGSEFVVAINSYLPGGVGTCDMAQWHILIEPEAGLAVPDEITLFLNGKQAN